MIMSFLETKVLPSNKIQTKEEDIEKMKCSYEETLKEKDKELEKSKKDLENALEMYSCDLTKLKENFEKSIQDRNSYKNQIFDLNAELTEIRLQKGKTIEHNNKIKSKLESSNKKHKKAIKQLNNKVKNLEGQTKNDKKQISKLKTEKDKFEKKFNKISKEYENFQIYNNIKRQSLHAMNIALESRNYILENERSNIEESLTKEYHKKFQNQERLLKDQIDSLKLQLKAMESNENDLKNVIDYQNAELKHIKSKLHDLNDLKKNLNKNLIWTNQENKELKALIKELNAEKLSSFKNQNGIGRNAASHTSNEEEDYFLYLDMDDDKNMENLIDMLAGKKQETAHIKKHIKALKATKVDQENLVEENEELKTYVEKLEEENKLMKSLLAAINLKDIKDNFKDRNPSTRKTNVLVQACQEGPRASSNKFNNHEFQSHLEFNSEFILAEEIFEADQNIMKLQNQSIIKNHAHDADFYYKKWYTISDEMTSLRLFCMDIVKKLWSLNFRYASQKHFLEKKVEMLKEKALYKSERFFHHQQKVNARKILTFTEVVGRKLRHQENLKEIITSMENRLDKNFKVCFASDDESPDTSNHSTDLTM